MRPSAATIICSIATALAASTALGQPVSEAAYVQRALASGDAAKVIDAERQSERAESAGLGLWPNPGVEWQRESLGAGVGPTGGTQDNFVVNVPLVLSGRTFVEANARDQSREAADLRHQHQRALLIREAVLRYRRAVAAQQRTAALKASRAVLGELAQIISAREKAGDAAGYDVLRIAIEASSVEADFTDAQVREQRALLEAAAFIAADEPIELDPEASDATSAPPVDDKVAIGARADIRSLDREIDAAAAAERAAARGFIPEVTLTGGAQVFRLGETDSRWGYVVGLSIPLPFFQRGQEKLAQAHARRALNESRRMQLLRAARAQLSLAVAELAARTTQVARFDADVVKRATELRRVAGASYRGGSAELLVVVDAERTWRDAQLKKVELGLLLKEVALDVALLSGRLDSAAAPKATQ